MQTPNVQIMHKSVPSVRGPRVQMGLGLGGASLPSTLILSIYSYTHKHIYSLLIYIYNT